MSYSDLAGLVTFRPLERPIKCDYRYSSFKASWIKTVELFAVELRHLKAERAVMQIDLAPQNFTASGLPHAARVANTPGVVLTMYSGKLKHDLRYEVGTFADWQDNVRAIALALEALRKVDRYGVTRSGEQYRGWRQLEAGPITESFGGLTEARAFLGELVGVQDGLEDSELYRLALRRAHPDKGGSSEKFRRVRAAGQALGVAR
jgi:hypothetical protein